MKIKTIWNHHLERYFFPWQNLVFFFFQSNQPLGSQVIETQETARRLVVKGRWNSKGESNGIFSSGKRSHSDCWKITQCSIGNTHLHSESSLSFASYVDGSRSVIFFFQKYHFHPSVAMVWINQAPCSGASPSPGTNQEKNPMGVAAKHPGTTKLLWVFFLH